MQSVIQRQLEYFNDGDLNNFISCFHKDIEVYNFDDITPILKGQEELLEAFREEWIIERSHAHLEDRIILGEKVIDHLRIEKPNSDYIFFRVYIYKVEDGLITKLWLLE